MGGGSCGGIDTKVGLDPGTLPVIIMVRESFAYMETGDSRQAPDGPYSSEDLDGMLALFRQAQVGRCVSGVTHDINNFLGAAQAYAELVGMDGEIGAESKRMLGEIVTSVQRCSRLVAIMGAIARPLERDLINLLDPGAVLEEIRVIFDYSCRTRKIRLEIASFEPQPSILAAPARVTLALIYLIWNAIESIEREGKDSSSSRVIRLDVVKEDAFLGFSIWNEGLDEGFDLASMRTPGMTGQDRTPNHMGLGLTAIEEIARYHEGSLSLEPEKGMVLRLSRSLKPKAP